MQDMLFFSCNREGNMRTKNTVYQAFEINTEKTYMIKPLEHKGFNKHFINLVSADVFMPKKVSFIDSVKNLFKSIK